MKLDRVSVFCYIRLFCNWSCSVATDTLGLYFSVSRQDMKLDRVSVNFYIAVICCIAVFCYITVFCN
jgi:hypothetical protein